MNISVLAILCLLLFLTVLSVINKLTYIKINRKQVTNDLYSARLEFLINRTLTLIDAICVANESFKIKEDRIKEFLSTILRKSGENTHYTWLLINMLIIDTIGIHLIEAYSNEVFYPTDFKPYLKKLEKTFKLEKEEWIKYANGTMYEECKKQALKLNSKNNWFGRKY